MPSRGQTSYSTMGAESIPPTVHGAGYPSPPPIASSSLSEIPSPASTHRASAASASAAAADKLPPHFHARLTPLLNKFPAIRVAVTPDPLSRVERVAHLQELRRGATSEFLPSLSSLLDFYEAGSTLPTREIIVLAAGEMVFHGTISDLECFVGIWLRAVERKGLVNITYPVVDVCSSSFTTYLPVYQSAYRPCPCVSMSP